MRKYTPIVVLASIWFMAKFLRYAFPPLFESVQTSYDVTGTTVGFVYSCLLTVYSLLHDFKINSDLSNSSH